MSQKLLMHIAYYMNPTKRLDNKHGMDKSSTEYTEHVLSGVIRFLEEINEYEGFCKKDVVLDVNVENEDVKKINLSNYPNINIDINTYDFKNEHPFRLTTKHRLSMKTKIDEYAVSYTHLTLPTNREV